VKSFGWVLIAALLAGSAGFGLSLWLNQPEPKAFKSKLVLYGTPRTLKPFVLTDARAQPITAESLKGRWSVLFFGFSHCPDICPATLAQLAEAEKLLGPDASPRMIFVSVDPERDTPKKMGDYVRYFSPSILGVTGSKPELEALTQQLGVMYAKVPLEGDNYTVDHSSSLFLLDPQTQLRGLIRPPFDPKALSADLQQLTQDAAP